MSSNPIRLQFLFDKYIHNASTPGELKEFWQLVDELSENDPVTDDIKALWRERKTARYTAGDVDWNKAYVKMMDKAKESELDYNRLGRNRSGFGWLRVAAAACVFALIAAGGLYYYNNRNTEQPITKASPPTHDAFPGATKAVLTLANGNKIILDSAVSGKLAVQGQTSVLHNNGALTYKGGATKELLYNTLTTAKGEQSPPLTLSDGTKVWLNAASSIRFPVAFTGVTREVEITGEAYFEVEHNDKHPFTVKAGKHVIEDIGTHFNVNSYTDEKEMKTTLIEGAVKIENLQLKPGQQAAIAPDGKTRLIKDADVAQAMAWKNGLFAFQSADLPTVLRQLSRWYDVEVEYVGDIPVREFDGKMQRDLLLSQVLKILENQQVHYKIENKKIIIMP